MCSGRQLARPQTSRADFHCRRSPLVIMGGTVGAMRLGVHSRPSSVSGRSEVRLKRAVVERLEGRLRAPDM